MVAVPSTDQPSSTVESNMPVVVWTKTKKRGDPRKLPLNILEDERISVAAQIVHCEDKDEKKELEGWIEELSVLTKYGQEGYDLYYSPAAAVSLGPKDGGAIELKYPDFMKALLLDNDIPS